jgi:ribonuclease G
LRLRDLGGVIINDFIDMQDERHKRDIERTLRDSLKDHKERMKVARISPFGMIEMTRQRVRQSHLQNMTEACPTCHGTGRVFTAETIARRVERSLRRVALEGRKDPLVVRVHPDVAMYVLENEKDLMKKLEKAVGFGLELRDDPLLKPDEFKLVVKSAGRDVTQQYAVA